MVDGDSESVVERNRVMNVEHDELVGAGCFQQLGDIPRCDQISRLSASILTRKCQIGENNHTPARTGIPQSLQQERQPQETFADRQARGPGQRL
jgi:hypothetical protein